MVLSRATITKLPGPDGEVNTADDVRFNTNLVTPFVDQNQTYTSHPSHQVFLREYITGTDGRIHSTGGCSKVSAPTARTESRPGRT